MIAQSDLAVIANGNSDAIARLIARRAQFGPPSAGMFKLSSIKTAADPGLWDQITGSASGALKGLADKYVTPYVNQAGQQFADAAQNQGVQNLQRMWDEHPELRWSLYTAGAGGLLGLGSGLLGRKKRPLSSLLTGALMGAGVGAGAGYLYNATHPQDQGQGDKTDQPPADQPGQIAGQPPTDPVETARHAVRSGYNAATGAYDNPTGAGGDLAKGVKNEAIQALLPDRGNKPLRSRILGNVAGVYGGKRIWDIARGVGQGFTNPTRYRPPIGVSVGGGPTRAITTGGSVGLEEGWAPSLWDRLRGGLEGGLRRPLSSIPLAGMGLAGRYHPNLETAHLWSERNNARYLPQGAKETAEDLRAGADRNLTQTPNYSKAVATEEGVEGLQRAYGAMPFPAKALNWGLRTGLPYGAAIGTAFLDPFKNEQAQQASAAGVNKAFGLPPPGVPGGPVNPNATMHQAVKLPGSP